MDPRPLTCNVTLKDLISACTSPGKSSFLHAHLLESQGAWTFCFCVLSISKSINGNSIHVFCCVCVCLCLHTHYFILISSGILANG